VSSSTTRTHSSALAGDAGDAGDTPPEEQAPASSTAAPTTGNRVLRWALMTASSM